jgi:tRNA uridine 5-carboxymethylaminomethyl modification enzyme
MNTGVFAGVDPACDDRPTLGVWLRRPEAKLAQVQAGLEAQLGVKLLSGVMATVETEVKYAGYISQQNRQIERLKESEDRRIPSDLGFAGIPGLSREICDKLERVRPETLGQAGRIPGVTPSAVAVLDVYLTMIRRPSNGRQLP